MTNRTKPCLLIALVLLLGSPMTAAAQDMSIEAFEERLDGIVLPPQPTRAQTAAYLRELKDLAERSGFTASSFGRELELFNAKLTNTFPMECCDLLASEVVRTSRLVRPASLALSRMDLEPAVFKKSILAQLEKDPALIRVVLANGWCVDARDPIVRALKADQALPSRDWFVAAVELKDPKLYKLLHEYAMQSPYAVDCINALEALPEYNLSNTVNRVYVQYKAGQLKLESYATDSGYYPRLRIRSLAAEYGNVDALGELIGSLASDGLQTSASTDNFYDSPRLAVIRLINFRGDNQAVKDWFKANREKLIFDQFTRRFIVQDDEF